MTGTTTLLRGEGYAATRWFFEMTRPTLDDLPEAPLPPGLEVRPVLTEEQAVAVMLAEDEAFRDHWGHRPESDADRRRWLDDPRQDLSLWQVAYAGAEVAGVVFPLVDAAENERFGRRPWRRRGVARALIVGALLALRQRGLTSAVLGVDADNPTGALGLYETVG